MWYNAIWKTITPTNAFFLQVFLVASLVFGHFCNCWKLYTYKYFLFACLMFVAKEPIFIRKKNKNYYKKSDLHIFDYKTVYDYRHTYSNSHVVFWYQGKSSTKKNFEMTSKYYGQVQIYVSNISFAVSRFPMTPNKLSVIICQIIFVKLNDKAKKKHDFLCQLWFKTVNRTWHYCVVC